MTTKLSVCLPLILLVHLGGCANNADTNLARSGNTALTNCESAESYARNIADGERSTVTLHWAPPTKNTDKTILTDLAGYRIDCARIGGTYNECARVPANQDSYIFRDLESGSYQFVVVAINEAGVESAPSNMACRSIL